PRVTDGSSLQTYQFLERQSVWESCLTACWTASSTGILFERFRTSFSQVSSCLSVHRRFSLLFAGVFLASLAPDVVDFGPRMLRSITGMWTSAVDVPLLFPWHWPDGSGSMYPASSAAPERTRILDIGQNTTVSLTNHLIVLAFAASGIFANPHVFRFLRPRNGGKA